MTARGSGHCLNKDEGRALRAAWTALRDWSFIAVVVVFWD